MRVVRSARRNLPVLPSSQQGSCAANLRTCEQLLPGLLSPCGTCVAMPLSLALFKGPSASFAAGVHVQRSYEACEPLRSPAVPVLVSPLVPMCAILVQKRRSLHFSLTSHEVRVSLMHPEGAPGYRDDKQIFSHPRRQSSWRSTTGIRVSSARR